MEICRIKNKKEKKEEEEEEEEENYKIYGILFSIYNKLYDTTVIVYEKQYTSPMTNKEIEASKEIYNRLCRSREQSSLIYVYIYVEVALKLTPFMWWPANSNIVPWKTMNSEY